MTDEANVEVDEFSSTDDLATIADRRTWFAKLTVQKRVLKAEERELQAELDTLEERVLEDYIELGTDSMRTVLGEDRYTVHLAPDVRAGPTKTGVNDDGDDETTEEDWQRACAALRAAGWGDLVAERFNHNSLTSRVREFINEHGPTWREHLPEEVEQALAISTRTRVRVRKV